MEKQIKTLAEALELTNIEVIDIQKSGVVVVYIPEVPEEVFKQVADKINNWGKSLGINVLVVPDDIKIQVIPHELVTEPEIYSVVNKLKSEIDLLKMEIKGLKNG